MNLTTYIRPRTICVATWLLAGGLVLVEALAIGAVSLTAIVAIYFGLGAGVELTLFIHSRQLGTLRPSLPSAPAAEDESAELVEGLRALGLQKREAVDLVEKVPTSFDDRMAMALQQHGEQKP